MDEEATEYEFRSVRTQQGVSQLTIGPKSTKAKVKDFSTWFLAWANYLRCMVRFFPHLAEQLVNYQAYIAQFSNQYKFSAVYAFDQVHRRSLANDPSRRWDVLDDLSVTLYLRGAPVLDSIKKASAANASSSSTSTSKNVVTCYLCGVQGHIRPNCPQFQPGGIGQERNSTFRNASQQQNGGRQPQTGPTAFCWKFNKGFQCEPACVYTHKCHLCRKGHPERYCPFRPSRPGSK